MLVLLYKTNSKAFFFIKIPFIFNHMMVKARSYITSIIYYYNKVHPLLKASTDKFGQKLRKAVELSKNEVFSVHLSTAIDPEDAHAIDVRYHSNCFAKHVRNVLRRESGVCSKLESAESEFAAETEFLEEVKMRL